MDIHLTWTRSPLQKTVPEPKQDPRPDAGTGQRLIDDAVFIEAHFRTERPGGTVRRLPADSR